MWLIFLLLGCEIILKIVINIIGVVSNKILLINIFLVKEI